MDPDTMYGHKKTSTWKTIKEFGLKHGVLPCRRGLEYLQKPNQVRVMKAKVSLNTIVLNPMFQSNAFPVTLARLCRHHSEECRQYAEDKGKQDAIDTAAN